MLATKAASARRLKSCNEAGVGGLRRLLRQGNANAWPISDLVNRLKAERKLTVKELAEMVGASRQRLSELRRTCAAFSPGSRRMDRDVHFHAVTARAAKKLGLSPVAVLDEILEQRIDSVRQTTRYLAERVRVARRSRVEVEAGPRTGVIDRCHHGDFRDVLSLISKGTVKLVLADAP